MQHDLEPDIPLIPSQVVYEAKEEMPLADQDVSLQVAEMLDSALQPDVILSAAKDLAGVHRDGTVQAVLAKGKRQQERHRQMLWRLSLMIGDGVLLIALCLL